MSLVAFFHMAFVFWVVLDPPGCIPIFAGVLSHLDAKKQRKIILREMTLALLVIIAFIFFGKAFFSLLNIDTPTLEIAGGIIIFLIALQLLFATPGKAEKGPKKEPFIVPLAIPMIAGPGILATISLYSAGIVENKFYIVLAVILAWGFSLPFLLLSSVLRRVMGENGLTALERLFGYILALIAIQMAVAGISEYFNVSLS